MLVACIVVEVGACELLATLHGGCIGPGTEVSTVTGGTWAVIVENPLTDDPGAATGVGPDIDVI